MTVQFHVFLDAPSVAALTRFPTWNVVLAKELGTALDEGATVFQDKTRASMHWKNPTGQLESSIAIFVDSPLERTIGTSLVYARRRNEGFSGMTDSLGRFYPHDPGAFFMDSGFVQGIPEVEMLTTLAVDRALLILTGGTP